MCGIAGIISTDPSTVSISRLKKMTDAVRHRGPDGEGHWINHQNQAALGSRRLAIVDLSDAGAQPMHLHERYTIVYNGEIYNYRELREKLKAKGYSFISDCDTEVILAAYDKLREDCVSHFDGMFAFAIWDQKEQTLFAARDRFGEKPFFYHLNKTEFIFASEMKALWVGGVPRVPNQKLLFNFLTIGYADNPSIPEETFFENILKLPAAHFMICTTSDGTLKIDVERYWELSHEHKKESNDSTALQQLDELLRSSVEYRYRSDVPVGTSLSGGLDSSSIVAMSAHVREQSNSHKCFTAIFPGFEKDEASHAALVAQQFGLQQFTTQPDPGEFYKQFKKLCYYQEEPFQSSSSLAQFKVYELAVQHNTKVLLDGQGADETLAGYHKYYKWYWQELFRRRRLRASRELQYSKELGVKETFGWKNVIASLFPSFAAIVLEKQYLVNALNHDELTKDFVRFQSKEAYYTTPDIFTLNGVLHFNTVVHGLEELLRYADRNSMAHGCEVRLPFLQHELVEFLFSLPPDFKIRNGYTKWLLRKCMENRLPQEIVWRKDKVGFEPPQKIWMGDTMVSDLIQSAKEVLVKEKILKSEVLQTPVRATDAYDAHNNDWRYLTAAYLFEKNWQL